MPVDKLEDRHDFFGIWTEEHDLRKILPNAPVDSRKVWIEIHRRLEDEKFLRMIPRIVKWERRKAKLKRLWKRILRLTKPKNRNIYGM